MTTLQQIEKITEKMPSATVKSFLETFKNQEELLKALQDFEKEMEF